MQREVWHSLEASVYIYQEAGSGTWTDSVVRHCEYCRDVSISKPHAQGVAHQPGKSTPDVTAQPGLIEASIGEYYVRRSEQFQPFLDSTQRYRVLFQAVNERYTGVSPEENDYHVLRNCVISSKLLMQENDLVAVRLEIVAERIGDYDAGD